MPAEKLPVAELDFIHSGLRPQRRAGREFKVSAGNRRGIAQTFGIEQKGTEVSRRVHVDEFSVSARAVGVHWHKPGWVRQQEGADRRLIRRAFLSSYCGADLPRLRGAAIPNQIERPGVAKS